MDAATRQHREHFEADPDAKASFEVLEEQLFMEQAWDDLLALYRRRMGAPSLADRPRARAPLQLRIGQILEERCEDRDGAIAAYAEAARLDPTLRPCFQALRRLYSERGSWAAWLQVAELEAAGPMDTDERTHLFAQMGDVWQREFGDEEQAEALYARAREAAGGDDSGVDGSSEESETLVQRAWLAAARGDSSAAVASLWEALERDPADIEALDMMVSVLEGAERHAEMVDLLERRAALATDPQTRAAVLSRLGSAREEQLGDVASARSAFERAIAAEPGHAAATAALLRIYRLTESWTRLRSLLESAAEQSSGRAQAGALCDLGELLGEQFDDTEAAGHAFTRACAADPECERARAGLASLTAEPERGAALDSPPSERPGASPGENRAVRIADVLERKLAALADAGEENGSDALELRIRIAELRTGSLDDPTGALEMLEPLLEHDDMLEDVAHRVADLYERLGRYRELADLARRAAEVTLATGEREAWYRRAAETARSVGEAELAIGCYERLLEEKPGDRDAQMALTDLHRNRGDAEPLARMLRGALDRAATPEREVQLRLELAELHATSLSDEATGLVHLRRALALDPEAGDVLDEALEVAHRVGGAEAQLDLLEHVAAAAEEPLVRARLVARRGDVMADALGWPEEAAMAWQAALALDPELLSARERLDAP